MQEPQEPQDRARSQAAAEASNAPQYYAASIEHMLREVQTQARKNTRQVGDHQARALFETTVEVLAGLIKAYDDYASDQRAPA